MVGLGLHFSARIISDRNPAATCSRAAAASSKVARCISALCSAAASTSSSSVARIASTACRAPSAPRRRLVSASTAPKSSGAASMTRLTRAKRSFSLTQEFGKIPSGPPASNTTTRT
eukprot:736668-Prorocentrum_minimum.AAC.2